MKKVDVLPLGCHPNGHHQPTPTPTPLGSPSPRGPCLPQCGQWGGQDGHWGPALVLPFVLLQRPGTPMPIQTLCLVPPPSPAMTKPLCEGPAGHVRSLLAIPCPRHPPMLPSLLQVMEEGRATPAWGTTPAIPPNSSSSSCHLHLLHPQLLHLPHGLPVGPIPPRPPTPLGPTPPCGGNEAAQALR